jgi:condensin complex subunit 2
MEGQQVRKVRPENVHFAKKAKRVDVKRLKDDIWSGLKTLVPEPNDESDEVSLGLSVIARR